VARIRPFRALRFAGDASASPELVVAPPYDVIDEARRRALLDRHPKNVVRLELPREEPGDEPDDRYRRVARTFAEWRSDGTLRKDPKPVLYAYEQIYRIPGTTVERTQRGFFARVGLEPYGPESSILPHERTLAGPREDRYRLLRATGVNTSPVIFLAPDPTGDATAALATVTAAESEIDFVDDEGTRHRLWVVPTADAPDAPDAAVAPDGPAECLIRAASAEPLAIADGHHRYETALRYRDERRMSRSCEEDPAFDFLLALIVPAGQPMTVLATHRIVRGLGDDGAAGLRNRLDELFEVVDASAAEIGTAFGPEAVTDPAGGPPAGTFGLWTRGRGSILRARRAAFAPFLPAGGDALRRLDVTLLGVALDRLAGIGPDAVAAGRLAYSKSIDDAIAAVEAGTGGADAAIILAPTPVEDVIAVASNGEVLPQKSTYFYPKALTGLVLNPHEW
jgi:uncharacterized protein (DUF1015 family)